MNQRQPGRERKHVVVLNQYAVPTTIGGGTRHVELFGRLSGWDATIVASARAHTTQELIAWHPMFKFVKLPRYAHNGLARVSGFFVYAAKALLFSMKVRRVDVFYGSSPHLLAPLVAAVAARLRRVPFILEVRDLWPESIVSAGLLKQNGLIYRILRLVERAVATQAEHIVVVTPGWEEHFTDLGIDSSKVTVIPNGSDAEMFDHPRTSSSPRDERDGKFVAVFAGSHGPKDGIDYVLDAAAAMPDVQFVLIGSGAAKGGAMERAREEGLDNVEFRAPVPKSELPQVLAQCDVGIHCVAPLKVFERGMSPNKLFDYLAAGLPIVSNAENALRHVMTDRQCGRLGGPTELSKCISDVLSASVDERRAWIIAGKELIGTRFSRSRSVEILSGVLESSRWRG